MAHPGFFYMDTSGIIREKFFEVKYVDRFTPNNLLSPTSVPVKWQLEVVPLDLQRSPEAIQHK